MRIVFLVNNIWILLLTNRYFPNRRDYHESELFYPQKSVTYDDTYIGGGTDYRGGGYGDSYSGGYGGAGYRKGYLPSEVHDGFRRSY